MPHLDWLAWGIWLVNILGELVAAIFVWRRGLVRRWPSLFSFLAIQSGIDVILLCLTLTASVSEWRSIAYFYVYWGGNALVHVAEMWMIIQIGSALVSASSKAVRGVWITAPIVATIFVFGASHLALWPDYGPKLRVVSTLVGLDRIVAIAWLATFLCVAVFSDILGIRWRRHPFGIAIGLVIQSTTAIAVSWFLETLTFSNAKLLSDISGGAYLLTLAIWILTTARREPIYMVKPPVQVALSGVLSFRSALQRTLENDDCGSLGSQSPWYILSRVARHKPATPASQARRTLSETQI